VSNNPEFNYAAEYVSISVTRPAKKVFYVPNNFVGPQTDILQGSFVRNSSPLRNTKTCSPASKV
jgi:hypothetical protein